MLSTNNSYKKLFDEYDEKLLPDFDLKGRLLFAEKNLLPLEKPTENKRAFLNNAVNLKQKVGKEIQEKLKEIDNEQNSKSKKLINIFKENAKIAAYIFLTFLFLTYLACFKIFFTSTFDK